MNQIKASKLHNRFFIYFISFDIKLAVTKKKFLKLIKQAIKAHKILINWYQEKLNISDYQLLWLVFFKGIIVTIVIQNLLQRVTKSI